MEERGELLVLAAAAAAECPGAQVDQATLVGKEEVAAAVAMGGLEAAVPIRKAEEEGEDSFLQVEQVLIQEEEGGEPQTPQLEGLQRVHLLGVMELMLSTEMQEDSEGLLM